MSNSNAVLPVDHPYRTNLQVGDAIRRIEWDFENLENEAKLIGPVGKVVAIYEDVLHSDDNFGEGYFEVEFFFGLRKFDFRNDLQKVDAEPYTQVDVNRSIVAMAGPSRHNMEILGPATPPEIIGRMVVVKSPFIIDDQDMEVDCSVSEDGEVTINSYVRTFYGATRLYTPTA